MDFLALSLRNFDAVVGNPKMRYLAAIVETLLRLFPFPTKRGLLKIGSPDRNSPVFLTCNFHLTVERVRKALKGIDAYLLVANSRGINVWCAAAGGLFTDHDVVSALKTSGIEELVDHREVILPQLAAAGIEGSAVRKKTGWKVVWGPVYAKDIPAFISNGLTKTADMRMVYFPLTQRIEMALAWAFPMSVVASLILLIFWRSAMLPAALLVWGLSFLLFIFFPSYGRLLDSRGKHPELIFFDFGKGGFQLILWGCILCVLVVYSFLAREFSWGFLVRWGIISFIVVLVLSMDLMGSTPIYKSGLHDDRLLRVVLDPEKCKGAGFCEQVCPRNCYNVDKDRHSATMPRAGDCVQCGACIAQCSFDALSFKTPKGEVIPPDQIRKFKLNLMGKRMVEASK